MDIRYIGVFVLSFAPIYSLIKPYLIYAVTPIHAGIGKGAEEYVDLPVQRDALGLPCIWGSSIKGAMRTVFRVKKGSDKASDEEKLIFGPEREYGHEHAGALTLLDARLFLVPLPSLKGGFVFATTGLMLERCKSIFEIADMGSFVKKIENLKSFLDQSKKALTSSDTIVLNGKVWIRDKAFETETSKAKDIESLFKDIFMNLALPISINTIIERIVVLPDEEGMRVLSRSTFSITRVALDYRKKTAIPGALWDEEYVPESSMFITALLLSNSRFREGISKDAQTLFRDLMEGLSAIDNRDFYLILGGHETIGKGIVKFCGWKP